MDTVEYHLGELSLVLDVKSKERSVPNYPCKGWTVLDIGCGIGQTLTASEFAEAAELHGVDVDEAAIAYGRSKYPHLRLLISGAEKTPYLSNTFDLTYSRVSLPYSDVRNSLREIYRITKPGGQVWLTMHGWQVELQNILDAFRSMDAKRLIDRLYVLENSILYQMIGLSLPRPWNGKKETVQTIRSMHRDMKLAGFVDIEIDRTRDFLVTAKKPRN